MTEESFNEYRLRILKIALTKNWTQEAAFLENLKPEFLLSESQRVHFRELYFKIAHNFSTNGERRIVVSQNWSGETTQLLAKMLAFVSLRYRRPDIFSEFSLWSNQRALLNPVYETALALENQKGIEKKQMTLEDFYKELENLHKVSSSQISGTDFVRDLTPSRVLFQTNLEQLAELNVKIEREANPWNYSFFRSLARVLTYACLEYSRADIYASFIANIKNKELFLKVFFEELSFEHSVNQFGIRSIMSDALENQIQRDKSTRSSRGCFAKLQE